MSEVKSVVNRGSRVFLLRPDPKDEKKTPRVLNPGQSIETLDEAEFKQLTNYKDVQDIAKIAPAISGRIQTLTSEIDRLKAENERLIGKKEEPAKQATAEPVEKKESKKGK